MQRRIPRRSRKDKGNVLVEAAFTLLSVLSLLIGVFDFGQFLFIHQALVERVRASARWGAIYSPGNTTNVQNMVLYNSSTNPGNNTKGYMGLTSSMVSVTIPDSGTNNQRMLIKLQNYPYKILSPFIGGSYTGPDIIVSMPLGPPD